MNKQSRRVFLRNVRARDQLELFLVSSVTSLLLVRFYLHLAGYPQLGGGDFHVAHMLYGGFLMLFGITIVLAFIGARAQKVAALLGGIGFGMFIDELGKFITRDNDYFYHPTVGLIYAVFIIMYLGFNFLSRPTTKLTSREYQLNALSQLEEAIIHDMDPYEKKRVANLLARADQHSDFTRILREMLDKVEAVPAGQPRRYKRALRALDRTYRRFWRLQSSNGWVQAFFLVEAGLFLMAVLGTVINNFDQVRDLLDGGAHLYSSQLLVGQLISSVIAAGFVLTGALLLPRFRMLALEQFRRATLINLFLTEFFIFARIQFGALPGFLFSVALLGLINYAIYQEKSGHKE